MDDTDPKKVDETDETRADERKTEVKKNRPLEKKLSSLLFSRKEAKEGKEEFSSSASISSPTAKKPHFTPTIRRKVGKNILAKFTVLSSCLSLTKRLLSMRPIELY